MKRIGALFDEIVSWENLELACFKAFRGKNRSRRVVRLHSCLTEHIGRLRQQLVSGSFQFGDYRRFVIYEPKRRVISAPDIDQMIVQHAVMNVCHDHFEHRYIHHSYASRPGKGVHAAVKRVCDKMSGYEFYAKLDIRKFFDSVDHDVLKRMLARMFNDDRLLGLMCSVIDSYETEPEKGLPIGNLMSQYFANLYMDAVDHHMLECQSAHGYFRYMDDVIFMDNDRRRLKRLVGAFEAYCNDRLLLAVKPPVTGRCRSGVCFLGYRVSPGAIALSGRSKRRFRHKLLLSCRLHRSGAISDRELADKTLSLIAFTQHARAEKFRRSCLDIMENNS